MRRYQFHSELTCDQVWYRLNALLLSFPVYGPKRYEISGELTGWGCYLWLRKPGGRGGTRLPLRLWTEETGESGCEICCRVFPHRSQLRWMLSTAVFLGLDMLLSEWESGASLFRIAGMSAYICCAAAFVLGLLFWLIPWIVSRKYSALLLDWVRSYLVLRELDGILLPETVSQRENWTGLPERLMRSPYVFHCDLPPEEIAGAMEEWAKCAGLSVKWNGTRITLSGTIYEEGVSAPDSALARRYKSWTFSDLFRGQVEPDEAGGCVLRGKFIPRLGFLVPQVLFLSVLGYVLFRAARNPLALIILLPAACWNLYEAYKKPSQNHASLAVLEFLRTYFQEV